MMEAKFVEETGFWSNERRDLLRSPPSSWRTLDSQKGLKMGVQLTNCSQLAPSRGEPLRLVFEEMES